MATNRFAKSKLGTRGENAEKAVQSYLEMWGTRSTHREFERLVDTKAAGRVIKAAAADFSFYSYDSKIPHFGLIEVKETEHEYRLDRSRITQMPRLRKRCMAGGDCCILIFHSTLKAWRFLDVSTLTEFSDKGSWDFRSAPLYEKPGAALKAFTNGVFD